MERDRYIELSTDERKISTHTLTWSVTAFTGLLNIFIRYFNSHAHVERDGKTDEIADILVNFNSHAHVERDLFIPILPQMKKYFNSHAHVERDQPLCSHHIPQGHFNSHAHVERDLRQFFRLQISSISTHTLTWSVTLVLLYYYV